MSNSENELYEFDKFRLDISERILWRGGLRLQLSEKAFETLCVLVRRGNHLVSKDELLNEIWTDTIVEENNVAKNISILRKALGERANGEEFIETVRGHGFRFIAGIRDLRESQTNGGFSAAHSQSSDFRRDETQPEANSKTVTEENHPAKTTHETPIRGRTEGKTEGRFWLVTIAIAACVGLISFGFYSSRDNAPSGAPITSVAVLPFINVAADPEIEYLSDGVSEALIDRLSELPQLKVIARGSSFKYRGENIDLQDAANKLGVQAIVTGRITRRGDDLSIRVELIDARENKQLWGDEFDRKASDVLFVEKEITQLVSEKLRLNLSGEQTEKLSKQNTVNPQAYELLLKARFHRARGEIQDLKKVVDYLQQAVAVDPRYALAYAELSIGYSLLGTDSILDPKLVALNAEEAARTALEFDEGLAEGHLALAIIKMNAWDWTMAEREYRRAIDLNPNLAEGYIWYSTYLSVMGRHEQAVEAAKRAIDLDPLSLRVRVGLGWTHFLARQYDQALEVLAQTLELDRNFVWTHRALAFAYMGKAMYAEAIAEFQEEERLSGGWPGLQIFRGAAYAQAGERDKAMAILRQAETSREYVSPGELYVLYAALGEREKAFSSLEKAYAVHDPQLQYLKIDPIADQLRDDQRFKDLLRRVGLSP